MKLKFVAAALLIASNGWTAASHAQAAPAASAPAGSPAALSQQEADATLRRAILSPGYQHMMAGIFNRLPSDILVRCPSMKSENSTTTILTTPTFVEGDHPTGGVWKQSYPVSGCGNDTSINIFFQAMPDKNIRVQVTAPGSTIASPQLEEDAYKYASIGAGLASKTCKTFDVINTRFMGFQDPVTAASAPTLKAKGPWHEVWTMKGCGHDYEVPLTFSPDATGTEISQSPGAVVTH